VALIHVPQPAGQQAVLSGVDDLAPDNAWAVGESFSGSGQNGLTLIEHWNGTAWSIVPSPSPAVGAGGDSNVLTSISGTGSDDLWAAGSENNENTATLSVLLEHWDGTAWTVATSPTPMFASQIATAITAISPDDVWVVGEQFTDSMRTLAAHWDGTAWSIVRTPDLSSAGTPQNQLTGVSAAGPTMSGRRVSPTTWTNTTWTCVHPALERHDVAAGQSAEHGLRWEPAQRHRRAVGDRRLDSGPDPGERRGAPHHHRAVNGSAWKIVASPDPGSLGNWS